MRIAGDSASRNQAQTRATPREYPASWRGKQASFTACAANAQNRHFRCRDGRLLALSPPLPLTAFFTGQNDPQ